MSAAKILLLAWTLSGCAHTLEVLNLDDYNLPVSYEESDKKLNIGIAPYMGDTSSIWYFNAIVERLYMDSDISMLKTNYVPNKQRGDFRPDYIVSIEPSETFESAAWNYLITFPGWIIFTAAWHGYNYYAYIVTTISIQNSNGNELRRREIETPYSIRHAELDRTFWPVFAWSWISILGGIYNALSYDSDVTLPFRNKIKNNYGIYISRNILQDIISL